MGYECSKCGRSLKSRAGQIQHEKRCRIEVEDDEEVKDADLSQSQPDDSQNSSQETNDMSKEEKALVERIANCKDAYTKHIWEQQLKRIQGGEKE